MAIGVVKNMGATVLSSPFHVHVVIIMNGDPVTERVRQIMWDFSRITGLDPVTAHPKRYLWTDAFAVCNFLELYNRTDDMKWKELAIHLVDQVHYTLGRHRNDDTRKGWISGLSEDEGRKHPTRGGLRIGKLMNERKPGDPYSERLEWDQDGQYYHYLTKWMHALNRISLVTGDPEYILWAIELAQTAHSGFTYSTPQGTRRMHWKMSIDLSRPLVPSMGQHDPLDGFVTFNELRLTNARDFRGLTFPDIGIETGELKQICRGLSLDTDDPLGTGGLLTDAVRITRMIQAGCPGLEKLLESVTESALGGVTSFAGSGTTSMPAGYRLAFRELGLSIGLHGVGTLRELIEENPRSGMSVAMRRWIDGLAGYSPLVEMIERFWSDSPNQNVRTWAEYREINMIMLATSLTPDTFLSV
jgi:hypothetical protein